MHKLIFALTLTVLIFMGTKPSCAQAQDTWLEPQQMQRDIDYYFNTVKRMHPAPYTRYSEKQYDSVRLELKRMCSQRKTILWFVYTMALANKLTDEYTGFDNLIDSRRDISSAGKIDFRNGTLWTDGKRIDKINGIDAKELFRVTEGLVPWTYSDNERQRRMRMLFPYATALHYSLMLPYECELTETKTGKKSTATIRVDNYNYMLNYKIATDRSFDPSHHANATSQRFFEKESIAIFYYNTSDPTKAETVRVQADGFFRKVAEKGIKNIFIDVSHNGGGSDAVHKHILRHLSGKEFEYSIKYEVSPGASSLADSIWRKDPNMGGMISRYREVVAGKNVSNYRMKANSGYKGCVFVVMGPSTYASAADFCDHIKRSGAGLLVGEPAGQRMPYAGNVVQMRLPATNIPFNCPTQRYATSPSLIGKEGFIEPDINYKMTRRIDAQDYLNIINKASRLN